MIIIELRNKSVIRDKSLTDFFARYHFLLHNETITSIIVKYIKYVKKNRSRLFV